MKRRVVDLIGGQDGLFLRLPRRRLAHKVPTCVAMLSAACTVLCQGQKALISINDPSQHHPRSPLSSITGGLLPADLSSAAAWALIPADPDPHRGPGSTSDLPCPQGSLGWGWGWLWSPSRDLTPSCSLTAWLPFGPFFVTTNFPGGLDSWSDLAAGPQPHLGGLSHPDPINGK